MKKSLIGLICLLGSSAFFGGCSSTPDIDQPVKIVKKYNAKTFFKTTSYSGASFSKDESQILINNNKTGINNVYTVDINSGDETQLTFSKKGSFYGIAYFPNDDRFLFTADGEGNELYHIYVQKPGGRKKDLTPGRKLTASFRGWNKDKSAFYIQTNERNAKFFDLYLYDAKTYKRKMIWKNKMGVAPGDISKDGRWLSVTKTNSNDDSDVFLIDLTSTDTVAKNIAPHTQPGRYKSLTFTPDSKKLLYSTDAGSEFQVAYSYDLTSGKSEPYLSYDWDIMYVYFSENGKYRVVGINEDAQTVLKVTDMTTGDLVDFPQVPGNVVSVSISPSEKQMAFYVNSDTSPSNLYTMPMEQNLARKLTDSLNPEINEGDLVQGHVVRYKSFDDLKIPAILYRPWLASEDNPVPAVIWVHGGPGGQSRKGYRAAVQHLVNHGYAVLMVNNRGSSGYGKTFYHLDDRKHGDVDLKDCIWGRKYLEKLPWINGQKIAIMGGSYGGYMVAAALTFQPEAFELGINIFGVTNWVRTLKSIPPYWESFRKYLVAEVGDPVKDAAALKAKSPLFHAKNIKKPLLVVQGANDPRVLKVESDEIVAAAKKNKVPVEYLLFKDEGHGFVKTKNQITASESYIKFLNKHLRQRQ
jgi:dipeptidyl aminopeptidase/acylaminoacyl peptidase